MFLSEEQYQRVLALLDKEISPEPLLKELNQWSEERYHLKIHDYICDRTNNGLTRLKLVVWDDIQHNKMRVGANYDKKIQLAYAGKFAELCRKYGIHEAYHKEEDIFVCGDTIKDQIISEGIRRHKGALEALKQGDVWKIYLESSGVCIFYETDAQIEEHEKDGRSELLRRQIQYVLSQNDRYHVFDHGVRCEFTSKQTLDEKYQGNMFYYHMR